MELGTLVGLGVGAVVLGLAAWVGRTSARARLWQSDRDLPDLSAVLDQVAVPESATAALVRAWADGRQCVSCGSPVRESRFTGHHVALLDPSGLTREWVDIGADRLTLALSTSLPVCWSCHVAATFRRQHPDLVTDREADIFRAWRNNR